MERIRILNLEVAWVNVKTIYLSIYTPVSHIDWYSQLDSMNGTNNY